jgi:hypothetical protein
VSAGSGEEMHQMGGKHNGHANVSIAAAVRVSQTSCGYSLSVMPVCARAFEVNVNMYTRVKQFVPKLPPQAFDLPY